MPGDPLDYSRFDAVGAEGREERLAAGGADWQELTLPEKRAVLAARERLERAAEERRLEEEARKRRLRERPADLAWARGRRFATYEAFFTARVEATLKARGNAAFLAGDVAAAEREWEAGVQSLLSLGEPPEEAVKLIALLRNNLAQLHIQAGSWAKAMELLDKVLVSDPCNEKALFRRARASCALSWWGKCEADLLKLVSLNPRNSEAFQMLRSTWGKLGKDRRIFGGVVSDIAAGLEELCPDGTVRKLRTEDYGEGDPDERPSWLRPAWLDRGGAEKVVVTCQMIIWSFGGEELYNSKEYKPRPQTREARKELVETMEMVHFFDQEARKAPRLIGDFHPTVKKGPVRWRLGDPGMYRGLDLAVRTMKPGERTLFEVDQPMLGPSVEAFYDELGSHASVAGLPQLQYHIDEERLAILEDEVPERELDLDSKLQRGVRVELTLLGFQPYRDLSECRDGSDLLAVLRQGPPTSAVLRRGSEVCGFFFVTRPFDSALLLQNGPVSWRLGVDEGQFLEAGSNQEPLRPGGAGFVPRCVADALLRVDWCELRAGCLVEARRRAQLHDVAPQYAAQFGAARPGAAGEAADEGLGAMCSVLVHILPEAPAAAAPRAPPGGAGA